MADTLVMLALSPTMEEGQLVKWLKSEGDAVESGDVVAEVETDKATMELESFLDGVILKILVAEGDAVPVGAPIAVVGEPGEEFADLLSAPASAPAASAPAETPAAPASSGSAPAPAAPTAASSGGRIVASPLARKLADEAGISLSTIAGSGPHGRIIKRDVEAAKSKPAAPSIRPHQGPYAEDVAPTPLSSMRRTIAKRLRESWVSAPHFFLEMTITMDAAASLRSQINTALAGHGGGKISYNDLVLKACALALQEVPAVNVAFAEDGMRHFEGSHIGVAVAVGEGLVVPVVRNAESKTLSQIAGEVRDLAGRARTKKLKPHEMSGSTFSVSNLGMYGIDAFTAVINPPEACILAVGALKKVAVVGDNDEIRVARQMRITLSCDHRAVDGATGAEFLGVVRAYLEEPMLLVV